MSLANKVSYTVLLPVINEENSLKDTVRIIREDNNDKLMNFIFLCSSEKTSEKSITICKNFIRENPKLFKLIFQKEKGLGGAFIEGFNTLESDYFIMMASDLETNPKDVKNLISSSVKHPNKIICTSRWKTNKGFKNYGLIKMILNYFFQFFFGKLFKTNLSDLTYGFRLYPYNSISGINWEVLNHGFLFESILKPIIMGWETVEIPTNWIKRIEGFSSNSIAFYKSYFFIGFKIYLNSKFNK